METGCSRGQDQRRLMRSVGLTNFGALLATGGRTDSEGRRRCVLQTHSVTPNRILEISYAFWQSKALLSAVELDVFTVLAGPSRRSQTPKQKRSEIPRAGPKENTHE
jgi:hypothetical protein